MYNTKNVKASVNVQDIVNNQAILFNSTTITLKDLEGNSMLLEIEGDNGVKVEIRFDKSEIKP